MKKSLIFLAMVVTGCAAGQQKTHHQQSAHLQQKGAWVPCEVEVVTYQDTSKTIARSMKTQWYCENRQ